MKHNNVVPNGHFHKKWQRRVRTWFDQVSVVEVVWHELLHNHDEKQLS